MINNLQYTIFYKTKIKYISIFFLNFQITQKTVKLKRREFYYKKFQIQSIFENTKKLNQKAHLYLKYLYI